VLLDAKKNKKKKKSEAIMRGNKRRKSETTWSYLAFPLVPRPNDFLNLTTNSRMQGSAVHPYIATYQSKILGLLDAFQK
jgi:hypothetical protein